MDVLKSYSNIWGGTVDSKKFHEHEISKIAAVFRNVKHQNKIYTLEYNYYLALLQYEHLNNENAKRAAKQILNLIVEDNDFYILSDDFNRLKRYAEELRKSRDKYNNKKIKHSKSEELNEFKEELKNLSQLLPEKLVDHFVFETNISSIAILLNKLINVVELKQLNNRNSYPEIERSKHINNLIDLCHKRSIFLFNKFDIKDSNIKLDIEKQVKSRIIFLIGEINRILKTPILLSEKVENILSLKHKTIEHDIDYVSKLIKENLYGIKSKSAYLLHLLYKTSDLEKVAA
ncbi:hypothetical protein HN836_01490 [Candidatus Woesearchaeota archaeon]|nr:hypothetical protein [Candidatus Woesearchaeota archaeon]